MKTIQQTTPALRFKDEQGNDYPDLEQSKLGNIGTTFNGLTGKNSTHFGKGKPYIQYLQVFENSRIDVDEFGFVEIGENESQNKVCSGDVFFTTSSETPNEVGTASVLIDEVENTFLNSFCFGYRVNKEYLLPEYARFAFRASSFRKKVMPLAQGSTRFNLSKTSLMKIMTNLPSIEEQQKIASFLSSVDTKIEQLGKKKALLEQYKKGMMQRLFSQEIRFKDAQGNSYPLWAQKKLASIGKFVGGGTPDTSNKKYWKGGIPWISSADISDGDISNINIHRYVTEEAVQNSATNKVPKNSVIFATRVGIGKIAVAKLQICISQDFTSLILKNDLSSFIGYLFQSNKKLILRYNQGTSIKGITSKDLKNITVHLPILKEQQKIADFLSAIDKKIELVAQQLEQARTFKKGLLQQMFI